MGSMSYCILENTAPELEECLDKLNETLEAGDKLSRTEYRAAERLIQTAQEIARWAGENDIEDLKGHKP